MVSVENITFLWLGGGGVIMGSDLVFLSLDDLEILISTIPMRSEYSN